MVVGTGETGSLKVTPIFLLWFLAAGAAGSLARYGVASLSYMLWGRSLWGTAIVNILGCLLFGAVTGAGARAQFLTTSTVTILTTGFLGAFTTFSTFIFDTSTLWASGRWGWAVVNLLGQNTAGLLALTFGMWLVHRAP